MKQSQVYSVCGCWAYKDKCLAIGIAKVKAKAKWNRLPSVLAHRSSEHLERTLVLQIPEIWGPIPTPVRLNLNDRRTGVRKCITTV